jgi:hypothetical protein
MINQRIIEKELLRIEKKHGALTPKAVVEESRPKEAVLHHHFTWDNNKAAQAYREWQARQVISVVTFQHPQMDTPMRTFQNVVLECRNEDGELESRHVYLRVKDIMKDPATRAQILERAHREASEWALKYKSLIELAEIISVIRKVTGKT